MLESLRMKGLSIALIDWGIKNNVLFHPLTWHWLWRNSQCLGLRVRIIYSMNMYHARLAGNFQGHFQKAACMDIYFSLSLSHTHTNKNELTKNALCMNWEASVESSRGNIKRMLSWSSSYWVSHGGGSRLRSSLENGEMRCGRCSAGEMRERREFIGDSHKWGHEDEAGPRRLTW